MFTQAPYLSYADLPIAYVLELGGEEFLGITDHEGNFQQIESLDEVPETDWGQVEMFGPGLGLLIPCVAQFVDTQAEPAGALTVRVLQGKPACAAIYTWTRSAGLTSSLLRQIPIATLVREAAISNTVRVLMHDKRPFGARYVEGGLGFGQLHDDLRKELATVDERARRRIISADFLQDVAAIYREALSHGVAPARAVQDALGPTTPTNARRWIAAARREGFLGPAPAVGRAGELAHLGS